VKLDKHFSKKTPMEILTILEKLEERCDIKFEVISGKIVPKEASEPLPDDVLQFLLGDNFSFDELLTLHNFPMASVNHSKIIAELSKILYRSISETDFFVYINSLNVTSKIFGFLYIPDLIVTISQEEVFDSVGNLLNPHSIIEVLSPSTEKKDRNKKKEAYQSIESLQEYVLIAQDSYKIEQYLRQGKTKWTVKIYDNANETCVLTVGVKIKLNDLYKNTDWAKKD
jgi:Uma2 family endonuclease